MFGRILLSLAVVVLALAPSLAAQAQELPSVPRTLVGQAGVVCVKINGAGRVDDAFVVISTGHQDADQALVDWVREMDWTGDDGAAAPRDRWFPMPVAFGEGEPPAPPASCGPVAHASNWS